MQKAYTVLFLFFLAVRTKSSVRDKVFHMVQDFPRGAKSSVWCKVFRAGQSLVAHTQGDFALTSAEKSYFNNVSNSSSESTGTPRVLAFSSLEPAASPARR